MNRRWVRNRALTFAVEEAYQGMLPVGRHPIAVLDLRIPPDEVDVNVHPTKAEVRLRNERAVFGVLQRAVRRALSDSATRAVGVAGALVGRRRRAVGAAAAVPDADSRCSRRCCLRGAALTPSPLSTQVARGARACGGVPAPRR